MTSRGGVLALAILGALLTGCASTAPAPPLGATVAPLAAGAPPAAGAATAAAGSAWLCKLDSLRWSHGFVARADARDCVVVLDSVRIGD
jgi:hypothetical protein